MFLFRINRDPPVLLQPDVVVHAAVAAALPDVRAESAGAARTPEAVPAVRAVLQTQTPRHGRLQGIVRPRLIQTMMPQLACTGQKHLLDAWMGNKKASGGKQEG